MESTKEKGSSGEQKACDYLESKGYEVVTRNYRTKRGEIDIIARLQETLVFVEVKTLPKGNPELLKDVLSIRKQKRIIKTAQCFLLNYRKYSDFYIRFDVIVIDMPNFPKVYHIENAFLELL